MKNGQTKQTEQTRLKEKDTKNKNKINQCMLANVTNIFN